MCKIDLNLANKYKKKNQESRTKNQEPKPKTKNQKHEFRQY
jgi:hypothetical protein